MTSNTCAICFETCKNTVKRFNCDHKNYCKHCIDEWIIRKPTCPTCRAILKQQDQQDQQEYDCTNIFINIDEETEHPKIYVWYDSQIDPAVIYKDANNISHNIIVIDRRNQIIRYKNDIIYAFS